jgi:tetratricopeptide (TPR) repeat protein
MELDFDLIKKAEKEVVKMRKEYNFFWAFPEVRFAIAKTLYLFFTKNSELENYIIEKVNINKTKAELHNQIVFDFYYADALNLIGKYQEANILQTKHKNIENNALTNYYHAQTQLPLFKVSRAITCIKTGNYAEAKNIFEELKKLNFSKLSFDIKDYVEIQYYILAHLLNPKDFDFQKKITEINSKISFFYLQNHL